jgi:DNA transformation protein and related proteins
VAVSPGFADFVVEQLDGCGDISTKRMFGGVGVYCEDVFFAIIDDDILYLKVDDTTRKDFEREGCGPFRPYGDDRETMGYYDVPVSILEDAGELVKWSRRAIAVAAAARAAKPSRPRRAPADRRRRRPR